MPSNKDDGGWKSFLWNSEKGEVMGRTGGSWCEYLRGSVGARRALTVAGERAAGRLVFPHRHLFDLTLQHSVTNPASRSGGSPLN